jgi:hypothetical protein
MIRFNLCLLEGASEKCCTFGRYEMWTCPISGHINFDYLRSSLLSFSTIKVLLFFLYS